MKNVIVVSAEKGKYKVLVDYIQRGVEYSSESVANHEANKIRKRP